jgi:cellulose synthase/poly-beta-1,6-N-acetylglucosamine synthase-like glycosyltransferase
MITVSIGIMAYNEERNIRRLLEALAAQRLVKVDIRRIIVVSSGSTDRTDELVTKWAERDPRVELVVQPERRGKSSAINLFLERADADVFVLESGDTIPAADCIERMVVPFENPEVGMAGGRPTPVDDPETFMGFVVHMLWRLHHKLALKSPKLGEIIAFRSFVEQIPPESAVDEASIEAIVTDRGLRLVYVPEAIVYNKGASTVSDFLKQRRRIYAGHLWLEREHSYSVSTKSIGGIFGVLLDDLEWRPRVVAWTIGGIWLEFVGRMLGVIDYRILKKNPYTWEVAESTKNLRA